MNKLYLLRFHDLAYIEIITYDSYQERYEKTKGIPPDKIYEDPEKAYKKMEELNSI